MRDGLAARPADVGDDAQMEGWIRPTWTSVAPSAPSVEGSFPLRMWVSGTAKYGVRSHVRPPSDEPST